MNKKLKKFLPKLKGVQINSLYRIHPRRAVGMTYSLFCSPRRGRVKPEQQAFLGATRDVRMTVDGRSVQVYRWPGLGKTVLLLHGWESNSFRWQALVEKLQGKGFNIVAFDAPGHGHSDGRTLNVPQYACYVDALVQKYCPHYLVGHSMGGMTAAYYLHKQPDSPLEKVVLLGAPSELPRIIADFQKVLGLSQPVLNSLEQYFRKRFGFAFHEFSTADFAREFKLSGLIVHDRYDRIVPFHEAEAICRNWKGATLHPTQGAGHSLNTPAIHEAVAAFLEG